MCMNLPIMLPPYFAFVFDPLIQDRTHRTSVSMQNTAPKDTGNSWSVSQIFFKDEL